MRKPPSYRLHRPSGQAVVTLLGKDHYLGQHESPESWQAYHRLLQQHITHTPQIEPRNIVSPAIDAVALTDKELILQFWHYATFVPAQAVPLNEGI